MFTFISTPTQTDFERLITHLKHAEQNQMHPALWPQRQRVADGLRRFSRQPEQQAAQSAYHALRLFLW